MIRAIFLTLGIMLSATFGYSQIKLSGKVTDEASGEILIGATVTAGTIGTVTDFNGLYTLELPSSGSYTIAISYVSYETKELVVDVKGSQVLDIGLGSNTVLKAVVVTADIAIERETPVAFSNIPTIKIEEELAAQDIPMLLNSTPGAYATESGGGDGDARISIRGFDQRYVAVMLDGIPVNDMENGEVYWSNWFGLDLVTQTMQVQRGLGASKISVPSVGGTINILTKGIDSKKGVRVRQEFGNNGYLRTTLGLTSGRMANGWGITAAGSYKQGDGWVDGNWTKGYFYYLRVDKQLGNHLLSFSGFGAPQEHGQRPFSAEAAQVDSAYARSIGIDSEVIEQHLFINKGRRYNDSWGMLNDELVNTRKNYYHKPQLSLRHSWQASDKVYLSNVAYLSIGNGGGVARDGASISNTDDDQLDLQKVYDETNVFHAFLNPRSLSNTWLRANINNHFWYGLLSTLKYDFSETMTFSGGVDARSYTGDHHREVYDLLGGTGVGTDSLQIGDIYEYDYTGTVNSGGVFGLLEYKKNQWASFINLSTANTAYGFRNNISEFELDPVSVWTKTIKLGATYKFNKAHSVFVNTGILNRAQQYRNVIITNFWAPLVEGEVAPNYDNEDIRAVELGYGFRSEKFSANFNGYYTLWGNKPVDRLPTFPEDPDDPESDRVPVNIPGIDAVHRGIELDFAYEPTKELTIEGLLSLGDWFWNSGDTVRGVLPNNAPYEFSFDAKGVHVGDAAQTQLGFSVRYEPIKGLYVKYRETFYDRNYSDFQPEDLQGEDAGRDSWQMPSYGVASLHSGYNFKFNGINLGIRANVINVWDAVYISDARNNDDFNTPSFTDFDAKSASVFFGQGRRGSLSIQASF